MEGEVLLPVGRAARGALPLRACAVAQFRGADIVMERADGVVAVSITDALSGQRVEIARIAEPIRSPHMAVVGSSGYFVSDTRRLYKLDLDRFTVSAGTRIRADKVLPVVGAGDVAYVPCISDSKRGYVTRLSRVLDEHAIAPGIEIEGELHDASVNGAGCLLANGERHDGGRPFGQGFALSWTPNAGNLPKLGDKPTTYQVFQALPGPVGRGGDIDASGHMRPPAMERPLAYAMVAKERREAFTALEESLGYALPARYRDLYESSSVEPLLRWRLQRIGIMLVHPSQRERALKERGLVPFAECDDQTLCIDASSEIFMPVVRRSRDGEITEVAPSFNVFLQAFLDAAEDPWPTTVDEIRDTLFGEGAAPARVGSAVRTSAGA